jgi:hypothetical protein
MSNADPWTDEQATRAEGFALSMQALVEQAYTHGVVLTVETAPKPGTPLAMGNYGFVVTARKRREMQP